ncbi:MAG: response regulator [Candidatus Omnitrophica bacterium]|nr:response regulator [Candidatus Omnitrophota bacterium]
MGKPKILLIEDDPVMTKILTVRLKINDFDIVTATEGEEGLTKARLEAPDLIIQDLMISNIDGFELCRMIKFDEELKKIPIIIYSSLYYEKDKKKAFDCGANDYFVKPNDLEKIINRIKDLLNEKNS